MKKLRRRLFICLLAAILLRGWGLLQDRQMLHDQLIRLHVVANSDSLEDQALKLQVRDAVLASIREDLDRARDMEEARDYILKNLPKIQQAADAVLQPAGYTSRVSLEEERFDTRNYHTFSLPAGVYESLRIVIGQGEGKNWWCVAFPTLCVPATSEGFSAAAQTAGFDPELAAALAGEKGYEIRFYLLDLLGRWEGRFFRGQ